MQTPKKPMPDGNTLEGFSFTVTESEAAAIYFTLKSEGFEPTSQGAKAFLLSAAGIASGGAPNDSGAEDEPGDLSEKVRKIIEAVGRNPEVTDYAIKKGAQLLGTFFKRKS